MSQSWRAVDLAVRGHHRPKKVPLRPGLETYLLLVTIHTENLASFLELASTEVVTTPPHEQ